MTGDAVEFEERWTGIYFSKTEQQSFRILDLFDLELKSAPHTYAQASLHRGREGHRHLRQRYDGAGAGERG